MPTKITVYQKPTCTKCRSTLKLLRERGAEFDTVNYFEAPLTAAQLEGLIRKLGVSPRDVVRWDEPVARRLGLKKKPLSDKELIRIMSENPDLIQRPIVVRGSRAVLGRPPENVEELL